MLPGRLGRRATQDRNCLITRDEPSAARLAALAGAGPSGHAVRGPRSLRGRVRRWPGSEVSWENDARSASPRPDLKRYSRIADIVFGPCAPEQPPERRAGDDKRSDHQGQRLRVLSSIPHVAKLGLRVFAVHVGAPRVVFARVAAPAGLPCQCTSACPSAQQPLPAYRQWCQVRSLQPHSLPAAAAREHERHVAARDTSRSGTTSGSP
jgi:hypothetical protein